MVGGSSSSSSDQVEGGNEVENGLTGRTYSGLHVRARLKQAISGGSSGVIEETEAEAGRSLVQAAVGKSLFTLVVADEEEEESHSNSETDTDCDDDVFDNGTAGLEYLKREIERDRKSSKLMQFFGDIPTSSDIGVPDSSNISSRGEEQRVSNQGEFSYSFPGKEARTFSSLSEVHQAHSRNLELMSGHSLSLSTGLEAFTGFTQGLRKSLEASVDPQLAAGGRAEQRYQELSERAIGQSKAQKHLRIGGLEDAHPLYEHSGIYELMDNKEVNGRGVWQKQGEEKFLFYALDSRRWHVCCTEANLERGRSQGWLRSAPNCIESDLGSFELFPSFEESEEHSLRESHLTPDDVASGVWEGMVKEGTCLGWRQLPELFVTSARSRSSRRSEGRMWLR
jgi:hypothetical protein